MGLWERVAPQVVRHRDGYVVQSAGRFAVEYVEGSKIARVEVERGTILAIWAWTLKWTSPVEAVPSDEERRLILDRLFLGLREMGVTSKEYDSPPGQD